MVLPSRYDPWPLVIVESAAAGLPIVHTECCGSAVECVRNYYSGRGVATENPRELATALRWCHEHHDELPEMGRLRNRWRRRIGTGVGTRWKAIFDEVRS